MFAAICSGRWPSPMAIWLIVLTTVFATESAVMFLLPWLMPQATRALEAMTDGLLLTAVLSPVFWWSVARPMKEVLRLRSRFVADLLNHVESDRRRTARELHDGVGQSLTLVISGLRSASQSVNDPDAVRRCQDLLHLAEGALQEIRRVSHDLRPSLLDDLGLVPALERIVADVREHHPVDVQLHLQGIALSTLPDPVATAAFRIIQEALSNVVRHSAARIAHVTIRRDGASLRIEISDDGCGLPPRPPRDSNGMGLIGMRERAAILGGTLTMTSTPGRGTQVLAQLPLEIVACE